jgi:MoaA/NifB/PqqE/SkfB family radical SAM enzyme
VAILRAVALPAHPLRIAGSLARARFGRDVPLKVTHLLTYHCNVECGFCTRIHSPSDHMGSDQVVAMMGAFARMGTRWWVFNGGEPTLVNPLGEYIQTGRKLGFNLSMVTNGTRIEHRIDELAALDLVICSIHGDEAEHDRVVGRQGSYAAALRGLRMLRGRGVEVCLLCVLNDRSRERMEDLLRLGEEIGAGVAFQPIVETRLGGAAVDPSLVPRQQAMADAVEWLLSEKMAGRPVSCSAAYLEAIAASWPQRPFGVKCWAGRLFCEVTPEGYVVPCCSEEEYVAADRHGPTVGWERAFAALPDRSGCQACWFKGPQELNLLLGLRPKQALRAASNLASGRMLWD